MRLLIRPALVGLLGLLPQFAQTTEGSKTLSQHDRDFAIDQLQTSRKDFLDAVTGLTPEQLSFKAGPDRWSIAECAEHITISEDFIGGMIKGQMVKGPATPEKRAEVKVTDEMILKGVPDRSQKFKAPEAIVPKKRWPDLESTVAHFKESRDANIAYLGTTQDDLRNHFAPHPALGLMDAYQWVLLMSGHTERHIAQTQEVKADPKYPK